MITRATKPCGLVGLAGSPGRKFCFGTLQIYICQMQTKVWNRVPDVSRVEAGWWYYLIRQLKDAWFGSNTHRPRSWKSLFLDKALFIAFCMVQMPRETSTSNAVMVWTMHRWVAHTISDSTPACGWNRWQRKATACEIPGLQITLTRLSGHDCLAAKATGNGLDSASLANATSSPQCSPRAWSRGHPRCMCSCCVLRRHTETIVGKSIGHVAAIFLIGPLAYGVVAMLAHVEFAVKPAIYTYLPTLPVGITEWLSKDKVPGKSLWKRDVCVMGIILGFFSHAAGPLVCISFLLNPSLGSSPVRPAA